MVLFGQLVVGPPGSGKTTYCLGIQMFMEAIGRNCAIVNLDFANDHVPYKPALDVRDLITLERSMDDYNLGPNGGLVYCMESLLDQIEVFMDKIDNLKCSYIIFDCPGQVELYTHHDSVHEIIQNFLARDYRLASVFLIDSFHCCNAATFISAVLVVASTMLRLGLPHISILSKVDLLPLYGPLPFKLDFFTELVDLMPLVRYVDSSVAVLDITDYGSDSNDSDDDESLPKPKVYLDANGNPRKPTIQEKHRAMSEALCDTLNDLGLVSFLPLDIQNKELVGKILAATDRANGYSFAANEATRYRKYMDEQRRNPNELPPVNDDEAKQYLNNLFNTASKNLDTIYARSLEIQEKYESNSSS